MSTYYEMEISSTIYNEIESAILTAIQHTDNVWEIVELVHLLDVWEDLKEEASTKSNEAYKRWMEQEKLFKEKKHNDIFMFQKIKAILENNDIELSVKPEFHLICDLADLFQNECNH